MIVNEQIEKVFGQNNYEEKIIKKPMNNKYKVEKKISNKKNILSNINIKEENISVNNNNNEENIKVIPFVNKNKENDFYDELMKKIKEEEKEENKLTQKKKHKPGFLKKEKSQSNLNSKNILNEKKEITTLFQRNESLLFKEKGGQTPNNKSKFINKKYNSLFENYDKINSKTSFKKRNFISQVRTQNLISLVNQLNKFNNKNKNIIFENEIIQHSVNIEIINNYKKFNNLKIQSKVNYNEIIKEVDFSNVKKLNLNFKKEGNSNNSDVKITDNINNNDEVRYQVPNKLLNQKKNSVFCCF
jgi:hypothetical protein